MARTDRVNEATIVCNAPDYQAEGARHLNLLGKEKMNIRPQVNLYRQFFSNPSDRIIDFIEIATFVYVADQCVVRCQDRVDPEGYLWHRRMNMVIAVRDLDFWSSPQTVQVLEELLRFLSDDCFKFTFIKSKLEDERQQYLIFDDNMCAPRKIERVMLFSGGLDSLGGAVQSLLEDKVQTVLVRHKSSSKHKERYEFLEKELKRRSEDRGLFFPVKTGKDKELSHEYTQRCRSLLYFALGATISHLLGLSEVLFFENGPVSINLPMNPQVIGGKATRTTHPKTLFYFQELFRLISGNDSFIVRNPFINKTKSDIVRYIIERGCGDLIVKSMSCAHSWQQTKLQTHCGVCSQCIDRRVAIIAADAEEYDNIEDYAIDFFNEPVDKNTDVFEMTNKNLLTSYFLRGKQISDDLRKYEDFEIEFPAIFEALPYMGKDETDAALDIHRLYLRLAQDICKVEDKATRPDFIRKAISLKEHSDNTLTNILIRGGTEEVITVVSKVEEELPDNVFRNEGGAWRIRYKGGPLKIVLPSKGCVFLAKLLEQPNHRFDVEELDPPPPMEKPDVDVEELLNNFNSGLDTYMPTLDEKAISAFRAYRKEQQKRLDEAKACFDKEEEEKAQGQLDAISEYLNDNLKKNGKARNMNKAARRAAQALARDVNTVIKGIKAFNPALAKHLENSLELGEHPIYAPSENMTWLVVFN